MKNLRDLAGDKPYYEINREERNVAALLYHLLLQGDNLNSFLKLLDYDVSKVIPSEIAIYYEYAFIRDLWNSIDKTKNEEKRDFILQYLDLKEKNHSILFDKNNIQAFNRFFGATRALSSEHIVSPANWSINDMADTIKNDHELLKKVCYFKWSFNAKPDIVIHTSKNTAICIEAKWGSNEGTYTATENLKNVKQMEIQEEVMKHILKLETEFCFLVKKKPLREVSAKVLTWKEVFKTLEYSDTLPFARQWIEQIINPKP